jgi:hypothetical protein
MITIKVISGFGFIVHNMHTTKISLAKNQTMS